MIEKLLKTNNSSVGLVLRITLMAMLLPMGYMKISNFSGIAEILQTAYSLPAIIAYLVILIEFFAPIFLVIGIATRLNAALIGIVMLGALFYHVEHGYFMNRFGNQAGEGYQFHLLAIGTAIASIITGGGLYSLDGYLQKRLGSPRQ